MLLHFTVSMRPIVHRVPQKSINLPICLFLFGDGNIAGFFLKFFHVVDDVLDKHFCSRTVFISEVDEDYA